MKAIIELPGVRKETIKLWIQDDKILHVKAVRKMDTQEENIEKIVPLPALSADKKPRAKYQDGVLSVTLQKSPTAKKEVPISVD